MNVLVHVLVHVHALVLVLVLVPGCGPSSPPRGSNANTDSTAPIAAAAGDAAPPTPAGTAAPYLLAADGPRGVIGGLVTIEPPPAGKSIIPPSANTACGTPGAAMVALDPTGGVAGALVWLDGLDAGKPPPPAAPVELLLRDCRFPTGVTPLPRLGAELSIVNGDGIRHEPTVDHVGDGTAAPRRLARLPMPLEGQRFGVTVADAGLVTIGCALHADEHAWAAAPRHPYFVATGPDGRYRLDGIPPGEYRLVGWHPPIVDGGAPLRGETTVTVSAEATAETPLTLR